MDDRRFRGAAVGRLLVLALVLLLLSDSPLAAQDAELVDLTDAALAALPKQRETYRIGFSILAGDLRPDDRVVALTFPRLLHQELELISERDLLPEEISASQERRVREALRRAATGLSEAISARDALLFSREQSDEARQTARANADKRVADARSLFTELNTAPLELVPARATLPIEFHEDHAAGDFLSLPDLENLSDLEPGSAALGEALTALASGEDLDLLVWGLIDEVQGYLIIDLYAYYRFLGESRPAGSTIVRSTDASLEAEFVADELARELLGRDFASVAVRSAQPGAAISVNGRLEGFGSVVARFLRPGRAVVEVASEGYAPTVVETELAAGERADLAVDLEPLEPRVVQLRSSPAGANVYANSVWIGRTPLDYAFPPDPTVVRIAADGFLESRFVVDANSGPVVSRALLPSSIDWTQELRRERDEFYQALTWFVLSIPVTMILRGGYESVLAAYPPGDSGALTDDELVRLARRGNILYWSSIGGLLVNAGLAVNLGFAIVDYVEVGEGPHNQ
jgi:hypothetical protein